MPAKSGDSVQFHFVGTRPDGTVFDTSHGRAALRARLGAGQIIPGLDAAIIGMTEGQEKALTVPFAQAYGPHDPAAVQAVDRALFPKDLPLAVGTLLNMHLPDGRSTPVKVTALTQDSVTIDANHPLAGLDLNFTVTLVAID